MNEKELAIVREKIVDSLTRYVLISNRIADKYNADPATHQSELGILMTEYTDSVLTLLQQRVGQEKERIEKEFIWGQVSYLDADGNIKEWTMRCISDEDWQALSDNKETTK